MNKLVDSRATTFMPQEAVEFPAIPDLRCTVPPRTENSSSIIFLLAKNNMTSDMCRTDKSYNEAVQAYLAQQLSFHYVEF